MGQVQVMGSAPRAGYARPVLVALLLLSGCLGALRFGEVQVGGSHDDAQYVVLAKSLASGQGYRLTSFPVLVEDISFPPGWPLILAPVYFLSSGSVVALKLVSFVAWLGVIAFAHRLFASRLGSPCVEAVTALVATHAYLVALSGQLMAESAYLLFSLMTLVLLDRWRRRSDGHLSWAGVVAVCCAVYTQLIRSIGLAAVLTVLVASLGTWRLRTVLGVALLVALALLPQVALNTSRGGFLVSQHYAKLSVRSTAPLEKIAGAGEQSLAYLQGPIAASVIPYFRPATETLARRLEFPPAVSLVNASVLLVMAVGFLWTVRQRELWNVYVLTYIGGLLIFRDPRMGVAQERFLLPLVPFFCVYLVAGVRLIAGLAAPRVPRFASAAVVAVAAVLVGLWLVANIRSWRSPQWTRSTDLRAGAVWIRESTPDDAVVMVRDPISRHLYFERKTVDFPAAGQNLTNALADHGVDYIVATPLLQTPVTTELDAYLVREVLPYVKAHPDAFRVVHVEEATNTTIIEVLGSGDGKDGP